MSYSQIDFKQTGHGPVWSAEAPSNLALIKYMGKLPEQGKNIPSNSSLSITLPHLRTRVEALLKPDTTSESGGIDEWNQWTGEFFGQQQEKVDEAWQPVNLTSHGQKRFIDHWMMLKQELNIGGDFILQSANGFPADCGLASSASSFAALTRLAQNISEIQNHKKLETEKIYQLSREGSGSSCRSFFEPWALWANEKVTEVDLPRLLHQVVLVDVATKKVSSSEAHKRIGTSWLSHGRGERSDKRLKIFQKELAGGIWKRAYQVAWSEFWDMHGLFETSEPSFGYMVPGTLEALNKIRCFWEARDDGPIVTMDAGPNVHLLYRLDQQEVADEVVRMLQPLQIWSPSINSRGRA